MSENQQGTTVATTTTQTPQVRGLYREVTALKQGFEDAAKGANLIAPVCRIDFIPPLHSISLRVIVLNATPPDANGKGGGGDVYAPDNSRPDELALTGLALDKVAGAAGISWEATQSGFVDDGSEPYYKRFRAVGWIIDFDGSRRCISGEKEIDLRQGSATIGGWSPKRLAIAREHIGAMAESKAKNRAIRHGIAIKSKYTPGELTKPFVVPKLVFTGETDDPVLKRIVAEKMADRALGITSTVYGPGRDIPALDATPPSGSAGGAPQALGTQPPPPLTGAGTNVQDGEIVGDKATGSAPASEPQRTSGFGF